MNRVDSRSRPPPSALELLREQSLATLAQQELERRIISGEFAAGAKLNEVDVATALGISRGPVREAFRALSQAGLVRVEKNRGVFVRQVSLEEASEFYEVRAALEGLIGRLAARRIAIDEIEQLRAVVRRMHQVQKTRLVEKIAEHCLIQCAGSDDGAFARSEIANNRTVFSDFTAVDMDGSRYKLLLSCLLI